MPCNHDTNKVFEPIPFYVDGYDLYLCECGAVIDLYDKRNESPDNTVAMSTTEVAALFEAISTQFKREFVSRMMQQLREHNRR